MTFPQIDPVLLHLGPVSIRWYAIAYLVGFVVGWRYCLALAKQNPNDPLPKFYDDFLTYAVIGTVLGGRIGYVLFYQFDMYAEHPLQMLQIWKGGMSFHGGLIGVVTATILFVHKNKISFWSFSDLLACAVPIGLCLGRLGNFVNGELWGRVSDVPWAMVFPSGGALPRHPSQLYEAGMEGVVLFIILFVLSQSQWVRLRSGLLSGLFLMLYGIFRFGCEFFREPDAQLGFLFAGATMGQLLCVPMVILGGGIIYYALRRDRGKFV